MSRSAEAENAYNSDPNGVNRWEDESTGDCIGDGCTETPTFSDNLWLIDYLVFNDPNNWHLVKMVCNRISEDHQDAKTAEVVLRHHIDRGRSSAQLNAATLWATMFQHASPLFIGYTACDRYLRMLQDVANAEATDARVRARILDAIALAARIHGKSHPAFVRLWREVKPHTLSLEEARFIRQSHAEHLAKDEGSLVNLETLMTIYEAANLSKQVVKQRYCVVRGSIAEIFKGLWNTRPVAVKILKFHTPSRQEDSNHYEEANWRRVTREIRVWAALKHRNIIEFLGYAKGFYPYPAMISVWCEQGTALQYLERHPNTPTKDRLQLAQDVSDGIQYLHQLNIVHGDLKPVNVLIDDFGVAKLCDFGLVRLVDWRGDFGMTTTSPYTGTELYKARELFVSQENRHPLPTFESDVYSLGCIILEFVERLHPYHWTRNKRHNLRDAIMDGYFPAQRPTTNGALENLTGQLWDLLQSCWDLPAGRPKVADVIERLSFFEQNIVVTGPSNHNPLNTRTSSDGGSSTLIHRMESPMGNAGNRRPANSTTGNLHPFRNSSDERPEHLWSGSPQGRSGEKRSGGSLASGGRGSGGSLASGGRRSGESINDASLAHSHHSPIYQPPMTSHTNSFASPSQESTYSLLEELPSPGALLGQRSLGRGSRPSMTSTGSDDFRSFERNLSDDVNSFNFSSGQASEQGERSDRSYNSRSINPHRKKEPSPNIYRSSTPQTQPLRSIMRRRSPLGPYSPSPCRYHHSPSPGPHRYDSSSPDPHRYHRSPSPDLLMPSSLNYPKDTRYLRKSPSYSSSLSEDWQRSSRTSHRKSQGRRSHRSWSPGSSSGPEVVYVGKERRQTPPNILSRIFGKRRHRSTRD